MYKNKKGQNLVEYALVAALIGVVAIAGLISLTRELGRTTSNVNQAVNNDSDSKGKDWCESWGGTYADGSCK